jgi:hypothetical protein
MITFYDYLVEVERRREQIVQAEKERLARQVSMNDGRRTKPLQRWLFHFGARLVVWGSRLQTRYAHAFDVTGALPAERSALERHSGPCAR